MAFPRYDSNLPWKEKKKILEAEIAEKKKPLLKIHRAAVKKKKPKNGG
jgi:hypothetical protein